MGISDRERGATRPWTMTKFLSGVSEYSAKKQTRLEKKNMNLTASIQPPSESKLLSPGKLPGLVSEALDGTITFLSQHSCAPVCVTV